MPTRARGSGTNGIWGVTTVVLLGLVVCSAGLVIAAVMIWIMR